MAAVPPRKRLQRIAAQLEPRPGRLPYYVPAADRLHRAVGWYWHPAGVQHAVFLAHNHILAELALLEQLSRQGPTAARRTPARA